MRYQLIAGFAALATLGSIAGAQERESDNSFKWTGGIEAGRTVFVRNLNGGVRVESGTGAEVEVRAEKRWRRGDPKSVKVTAEKTARGDVLVCAIWEKRNTRCDEDGYSSHGGDGWFDRDHDNDVSVEITIRLPKGVRMDASTVNGGLTIEGATAQVKARTVSACGQAPSAAGRWSTRPSTGPSRSSCRRTSTPTLKCARSTAASSPRIFRSRCRGGSTVGVSRGRSERAGRS